MCLLDESQISLGPDQLASAAHDLGLHCLFKTVCLNTQIIYDAKPTKRTLMQFVDNIGPDQCAHL